MNTASVCPQGVAFTTELGITHEYIGQRGLLQCPEATELVSVGLCRDGREHFLTPLAAQAWLGMRTAAATDGVELLIVSAFRSVARQAEIVRRKLDAGQHLADVLAQCAPPGFSEHHSGRAIDVTTPGSVPLEASFDQTAAFRWLSLHAGGFGFRMSYPVGNAQGFSYEPWHWCLA
jgi:zinc D-Ala-D-Ala carboxypeptidase